LNNIYTYICKLKGIVSYWRCFKKETY